MKSILQTLALVFFSIALSLVVAEVVLWIDGRYHDLASHRLIISKAIWEPPANRIEVRKHPDLSRFIEIHFDNEGVRNHSESSTRDKRNIIGFFGDSFTENRRVDDRFSLTSILDVAARPRARVVNYGVGGYGLDQSYLRYKKYEKHDIHDVVYIFCENDLPNLDETDLTEMTQNGDIAFRDPRFNPFYQLIGRFHVTYLVISAYYKVRMLVDLIRTGKYEWTSVTWRVNSDAQAHRRVNQFADAIAMDFLSPNPSTSTLELAEKFLVLLEKWRREVEASQRTFTVLVLPWKIDDEVATKLLRNFEGSVVHSTGLFDNCENYCKFQTDGHWNEYGNAKMAKFILSNGAFPFRERLKMIDAARLKIEVDEYYDRLPR
jgi:hypothetical protein